MSLKLACITKLAYLSLVYRNFVKPLLAFIIAFSGIIILSPLFIIIALWIWRVDGHSPFFLQKRSGKSSRIFTIIKFRTMTSAKDAHGNLLSDELRLTKWGSFLRETSLDELPQLINVLKGDMSLVGPRPMLPYYLNLYNDFQRRRNEVKPGITGWAQVNGRNAISWERKFELDVWYVDHMSFMLDLKILLLTVKKVFVREGITQEGHVTSEEFKGNL